MYGVARGFVLGAGAPEKAKYMCILEAPGKDELSFGLNPNPKRSFLQTAGNVNKSWQYVNETIPI